MLLSVVYVVLIVVITVVVLTVIVVVFGVYAPVPLIPGRAPDNADFLYKTE